MTVRLSDNFIGNHKQVDMTMDERILAALRANPMTEAELAEVMRVHTVVLRASWLRPMMGEGLVVQIPDGRLVRGDELEQVTAEVANG